MNTPRTRNGFKTIWSVLRLIGAAPGLMIAASSEYRRFRKTFIAHAVSGGLPPEAAEEIAKRYKPTKLIRSIPGVNNNNTDTVS
ncbi:MAG: hypothetical protein ACOYI6_05735 [Christensenellales bacterium]|jgi:hypothetical protein|nr:hypothetical protein [Clostridiales bacterium]